MNSLPLLLCALLMNPRKILLCHFRSQGAIAVLAFALGMGAALQLGAAPPFFETNDVFVAHETTGDIFAGSAKQGVKSDTPSTNPPGKKNIYYLSPGMVVTNSGTVLVYTECRNNCHDWGDIHVNLRRSTDGGRTWDKERQIAHLGDPVQAVVRSAPPKEKGQEDAVTINNPVAIADRNGSVHMLYCVEYRRVFSMRSDDDGRSWSKPVEISQVFEKYRPQFDWKIIATGPGHGIQLKNGRLVVPIWMATGAKQGYQHYPSVTAVTYSDDHGQTWQAGDMVAQGTGRGSDPQLYHNPNETCSIQLADGKVLFNIRVPSARQRRLASLSPNGATDWSKPEFIEDLPEPLCFGGMARLSEMPAGDKNRIVFSHCNGLEGGHGAVDEKWCKREDMTVYLSYDEGKTWPVKKSIAPGFAGPGYSDMAVLPDGTLLCLYCEPHSKQGKGSSLAVARFNLEWLTDGKDSLHASSAAAAGVPAGAAVDAEGVYDPPTGQGRYILTPPETPMPHINGPAIFGVRPGSPFLYTIPVSGERPIRYIAEGLPPGLHLDANSGRITGTIESKRAARYQVKLAAENSRGRTEKPLTIVVGDTICLTPPLGWNSWNAWGHKVSQSNVLASARAMVDKGLARYGWTYINIDDTWQGKRGGPFNALEPNEKFPDMKKLCDDVHALGLKIGIYSTPWITSYAGFPGGSSDAADGRWTKAPPAKKGAKKADRRLGQFLFADNDAKQWAAWEIDYLKYDWNPNDPASVVSMAEALNRSGRDIVYSLSNGAPIASAEVIRTHANCWRTTGDLKDRWSEKGPCLSLVEIWDGHRLWLEKGARGGPGHFPDADMLVVGDVVEENNAEAPRPSRLTADEQYTHISLWSLWSCPLLIGCPIERMDAFTLNLLTNREVLSIQQDARGLPGRTVRNENGVEIIVKELADGSAAVGLFNRNADATLIVADWKTLGLSGPRRLRDVWRNNDIGSREETFAAMVRPHGVVLLRASPTAQDSAHPRPHGT